jgi:ABC-type nitrate/sulfonate/bicarbonate transport system substrate-binding protein
MQLGWLANVENMGPYMADHNGYYADEGLDMTITQGGPSVVVEPLVASGRALVGLSSVDTVARARNEGAPLRVVAATLQINPTSIMSLASSPVTSLKDLVGKRLGIQTGAVEMMRTLLETNGISPDDVEFVTVEFDPAPMVNGDVDAFVSFLTNQPVHLAQEGIKTHTFQLADYGHTVWSNVFVVSEETLADKERRADVIKVIRATRAGWEAALADTDEAARVVVDEYGADLNLDLEAEQLGAAKYESLIVTEETSQNGLLSMSPKGIESSIETLDRLGIEANPDELFDTSLLEEV